MDEAAPEDSTPPVQSHAEQDPPELPFFPFWVEPLQGGSPPQLMTVLSGGPKDTPAGEPSWLEESRRRVSSAPAPVRRFCERDEAIAWLARGDEAFAVRYAGAEGKENRRSDVLYPSMSKLPGHVWAAAAERLRKACLSGQVRSDREEPLEPNFWLVRDVTDPEVADVVFVREDLRQLLKDDGSDEGDRPDTTALGGASVGAGALKANIMSVAKSIAGPKAIATKRGRPPKEYWGRIELHKLVDTNLEDYGIPEPGDGRQAALERMIKDELAKTDNYPAESTIRNWVKGKIDTYREREADK
jgi:hypothetical protein